MTAEDRARRAPKAAATSDVRRPRALLFSAIGALVGAAAGVAAEGVPAAAKARPIARPHAGVACASCHGEGEKTAATTCTSCHGVHPSTRGAHRALAAKGVMTCPTCHAQHEGAQGVTFGDGGIVRWGSGAEEAVPVPRGLAPGAVPKGTTVAIASVTACARCHDTSRTSDPIAACAEPGARASRCFDEHAHVGEALPARGVCAAQHSDARFVAWEATREIATSTPWVGRGEGAPRSPWLPPLGAAAFATFAFALASRASRRKAPAPAAPPKVSERKRLPVVDTATCIGCWACVDACPFDVLTVESYVAVVARPEECCGVVLCEQVCPNGSLRIADGELVPDQPKTNDLESCDVPGLYIAGDLSGLPLIKNAIHQGAHAVDRLASTLPRRRDGRVDVVVIGAGPAGLSAALRAQERGLSCLVLEQATIAASIKSFPRDKIVHDPPLHLPVVGPLWLQQSTKEEIVAQWTRIVRARSLDIREGHRVVDVGREGDGFVVRAVGPSGDAVVRASRVILAIGRRGTPRTLDGLTVEPGAEDRIAYALADARSFAGKSVLVVGLGDSAMEAAVALARQPGTTVTMSYRGQGFARGKAKNIKEVEALVQARKIRLLLETVPVAMTRDGVTLGFASREHRVRVAADAMLVLIGGSPSWDLLTRAGIRRPRKEEGAGRVVAP